jgi:hypothetical protein
MMIRKSTRPKRVFIISIVLLILVSFFSGLIVYQNEREAETHEKLLEIESLSRFKILQVSEWYSDEINDALVISRNQTLVKAAELVVNGGIDNDKSTFYSMISELKSEHGYQNVFLKDFDKKVLSGDTTINQEPRKLIYPINNSNFDTSGFYIGNDNKVYFDLITPIILDSSGKHTYIVFEIDPEEVLFPLLSFFPVHNETYETFLLAAKI